MIFYISEIIKSISEAFESIFDYLKKNKDKQVETEILHDKKTLKKASNISEEIIQNTDNFFVWVANLCWDIMSFRQRRQFTHFLRKHKKLKKQFERNN